MLKLKKIAVTGGLASGKTTVCRILEKLGAHIASADEIVHQLLSTDTSIGKQVVELIGPNIVEQGTINRTTIAKRVFNQPNLLRSLEEILHPAVRAELDRQYDKVQKEGSATLFAAEIPLLFESGTPFRFDAVIAVTADAKQCQERFTKKTGYSASEWNKRMEQQIDPGEKARRADYIISNNGSLEDIEKQTKQIYEQLTGD